MIGGPLPALLLPVITNPLSGSCAKIVRPLNPVGAPAVERIVSLIATVCDVPSVIVAIGHRRVLEEDAVGGESPATGGFWTTE